jgi:tetratricopeptide (TPR) repeat protein
LEALVFQERFNEAALDIDDLKKTLTLHNEMVLIARFAVIELKIAYAAGNMSDFDQRYALAITTAQATNDTRIIGEAHLAVGTNQIKRQKMSEGILSLKTAFENFEQEDNEYLVAVALTSIANAYTEIGDYNLAIEYHQQALTLYESQNNPFAQSVALFNIAKAYEHDQEFTKALEHFNQAKRISMDIQDSLGVTLAHLWKANIYLAQENWETALKIFDEVISQFNDAGDTWSEFYAVAGSIQSHIGLKNIATAQTLFPRLNALASELDGEDIRSTHAEITIALALANGDYESAFHYLNIQRQAEQQLEYRTNKRYILPFVTAVFFGGLKHAKRCLW